MVWRLKISDSRMVLWAVRAIRFFSSDVLVLGPLVVAVSYCLFCVISDILTGYTYIQENYSRTVLLSFHMIRRGLAFVHKWKSHCNYKLYWTLYLRCILLVFVVLWDSTLFRLSYLFKRIGIAYAPRVFLGWPSMWGRKITKSHIEGINVLCAGHFTV